jgi:hypothetical protein
MKGWFRGYSQRNCAKLGIFPSNFVQIKAFKSEKNWYEFNYELIYK